MHSQRRQDGDRRPRLTPAVADVRRAVRETLAALSPDSLVLVALSGGPDSLALAAATAFEAPRAGLRAGAVIVDHQLQDGSRAVADRAAEQARALGLDPVEVVRVDVAPSSAGGGPEAAARDARYAALDAAARRLTASAVLLGHTVDDQAETVLLGLARGSGAVSLSGMAVVNGVYRRPFLGLRRASTVQACRDQGLEPWSDPHNLDPAYTRVRVRDRVLPLLEAELDPGVVEALARTAELVRDDADALDRMVVEVAEELVDLDDGGCSVPAAWLVANPRALGSRLVRLVARVEFGLTLSREQTVEVLRLATDWHGQGAVHLRGVRVRRAGTRIVFTAAE
ncbi:tRNA(Ile)-lysidine synthase [Microcella alkaliphila]|uniref:tRNA(Ile)-lysidine synthase n=1 Tax=Microcella alkaliphila TaxID=279828 RepID=A0A4V2FNC9_9MICO|nr:tRNA lysidine(34) synthetase TilS [Microcella alkaliphila]RZT60839.1 tRNA(Ile)-lysidine synthase [Microcella alkaliphila]